MFSLNIVNLILWKHKADTLCSLLNKHSMAKIMEIEIQRPKGWLFSKNITKGGQNLRIQLKQVYNQIWIHKLNLLIHCVFLHESIKLTGYVTFMATNIEVEFIKSCLQEAIFFKNFRLRRAKFQDCLEISIHVHKTSNLN